MVIKSNVIMAICVLIMGYISEKIELLLAEEDEEKQKKNQKENL